MQSKHALRLALMSGLAGLALAFAAHAQDASSPVGPDKEHMTNGREVDLLKDQIKGYNSITQQSNTIKPTVYANPGAAGSAAAPTAGLHFTPELLEKLKGQGVGFERVQLHVGLDTFQPVKEENALEHKMHSEWCAIDAATAEHLNRARQEGGRVVAVGTTATRTLESAVDRETGIIQPFAGDTQLYLYPGKPLKAVDALITNFHLPRSTLLLLVSAFAGREFILEAYNEAVKERYRFFSFGDAMFIF